MKKEYTYDFICDDILETELPIAFSKINSTIDNLGATLGYSYFNSIKRVIFIYKPETGWKPEAMEKFEE
jgi:hypothetical protein